MFSVIVANKGKFLRKKRALNRFARQ